MSQHVVQKPRVSRGIFFLIVMGLFILGIVGFILTQRGDTSALNIASGKASPLPVNVITAEYSDTLEIREQYTGLVSARRSSALGFETGGRLQAIHVDVGDTVKKGAVLARLDTRTLEANLAAANAQTGEAEANLKLAKSTSDRQAVLEEKGLLSSQRFDESAAQADAAQARLAASSAQIDALKVRIDLSRLTAPFDGVITRRMVDEGAIAGPGQPVLQLVEVSALETSIGLPSAVTEKLMAGEVYQLRIDDRMVPARLRNVTGVIDASQRTMNAVFDIDEEQDVQPGSVARLELKQTLDQRGFWIPVSAMTEAERGLWGIYAVRQAEDGQFRVEKQLVDILHAEADRAFVRGSVSEGDRFVLNGLHRITPGQIVSPETSSSSERTDW